MKTKGILKGIKYIMLVITSQVLLNACISYAPINSSFENAETLGAGRMEFMGNYSSYSVSYDENDEEEYHFPDIIIYFRGEAFTIYIGEMEIDEPEATSATVINIQSDNQLRILRRYTDTEDYFIQRLKDFLPTS